ncbi:hypothetical protein ACROYT_G016835 [Oculina patagonica]
MKSVIFAIVILIGSQGALALKCYQCTPNFSNISSALSVLGGMGSLATICGKPNVSVECSGSGQDSCVTITIKGKVPVIGEVTVYSLDCGMKAACGDMFKNMTCSGMKNATGQYGAEITSCDVSCCQGDLCNKPVVSSPTPAGTTASPAGKTTVKSSAKSISFATSFAILGILGAISVAFLNQLSGFISL